MLEQEIFKERLEVVLNQFFETVIGVVIGTT
jgi:hypothetical protein